MIGSLRSSFAGDAPYFLKTRPRGRSLSYNQIRMKEVEINRSNAGQKAEKFVKKYLPEAPLGFIYKAFRKKDIKANGHWIKNDYVL